MSAPIYPNDAARERLRVLDANAVDVPGLPDGRLSAEMSHGIFDVVLFAKDTGETEDWFSVSPQALAPLHALLGKLIAQRGAPAAVGPVCADCNDTHRVHVEDRGDRMCTRCPVPCLSCCVGAFCATTPCGCGCHARGGK